MAQYEANNQQLENLIGVNSGLSLQTQLAIQALIDGNTPVLSTDDASGTDNTNVGLVSQKDATFNDATFTKVETAVFDEGASGNVNLTSDEGVIAQLVKPDGLNVSMGNGGNNVDIQGGQGLVNTGDGMDEIMVHGKFNGELKMGRGDDALFLDEEAQNTAEISVDAGDGFDLLTLFGRPTVHSFTFSNGRFIMHSADVTLDGVELIGTDVNGDGKIENGVDHITILAHNEVESLVAKLYKVALGREAIDGDDGWGDSTLGGFKWWTTEFQKTDSDHSTEHLVRSFLNCDEFHNRYAGMNNTEYVNALYDNLGTTDAEQAASYIAQLDAGTVDRETVAWNIAASDLAVQVLGNDGEQYVINGYDSGF